MKLAQLKKALVEKSNSAEAESEKKKQFDGVKDLQQKLGENQEQLNTQQA